MALEGGVAVPQAQDGAVSADVSAAPNNAEISQKLVHGSADAVVPSKQADVHRVGEDEEAVAPAWALKHSWGLPASRRYNLHYIDDGIVLLASGNSVQLLDLLKGNEKTVLMGSQSPHCNAIGAVAVHPSRRFFAVAEKGVDPRIVVYSYPSLQVVNTLRKGTERAYRDVVFSPQGDQLASVGGAPDFLLTIWEWKEERIVLHTKAFSQDVFRVAFSPVTDGRLLTAGSGHIRFWKMAHTFTGLKLQGNTGKFGNVEISDIPSFVELPSGKVVSGSESGALLMWNGHFVQYAIGAAAPNATDKKAVGPCHQGVVEFVGLEGDKLVTAGQDGFFKIWELEGLEFAETPSDNGVYGLKLVQAIKIGENAKIKAVIRGDDHWLIQDQFGSLWRMRLPEYKLECALKFHAGGIVGTVAVHTEGEGEVLVSAGEDGTVRAWRTAHNEEIVSRRFNARATSITTAPASVDAGKQTTLIGFGDGVVRIVQLTSSKAFRLVHAFKPHSAAVTHISCSSDGDWLATAAQDGTVFFFDIKGASSFEPLGFIKLPHDAAATSLSIHPDNSRLLVTANDQLLLYTKPQNNEQLASSVRETFLLSLPHTQLQVCVAAPPSSNAEGEAHAPKPVSRAVCAALFADDGKSVYVCLKGEAQDALSKLYVCALPHPSATGVVEVTVQAAHPLHTPHGEVHTLQYSSTHKHLLLGTRGGAVEVRPVEALHTVCGMQVHDGDEGPVSSVLLFNGDTHLCTSGYDGNLFVFDFAHSAPKDAAQKVVSEEAAHTDAAQGVVEDSADILNAKQYSLEEAKQKQERDEQLAAAERKKAAMRAEVCALREEFAELVKRNLALEPSKRLPREAFELDPELRKRLEAEAEQKVAEVKKELAWEAEKHVVALQKLKDRYLDKVLVEHIRLAAFRSPVCVTSFRVQELPEWLQRACDEVHAIIREEETAKEQVAKEKLAKQKQAAEANNKNAISARINAPTDGGSASRVNEAEARKRAREERRRLREQLEASKPDPNEDDPEDVALIHETRTNMGDYKLKSDPNYVVPEKQRVNATKKRRQMVLLQESVHFIKMGLNERFLALRDLKKRIIENVNKDNRRIQEINRELGLNLNADVSRLEVDLSEWPESRYQFNDADLIAFEKKRKQDELRAANAKKDGGMFGSNDNDNDNDSSDATESEAQQRAESSLSANPNPNSSPNPQSDEGVQAHTLSNGEELSPLEIAEKRRQKRILEYERKVLLQKIDDAISAFDKAVYELRREKLRLDADLKSTDLKLLTLYQELQLLKQFEGRENDLFAKLAKARGAKAQIVGEMAECEKELSVRLAEIQSWQEKDKQVLNEFNAAVGGNKSEFYPQLLRIFKKKVKRNKKKSSGDNGDHDQNSEGEDDVSESQYSDGSDNSDSDADEDDDSCPVGCDSAIYEKVLELREKKLEQEEILADFNAVVAELHKKYQQHQVKEKAIDKELYSTEAEIQAFQTEKQLALNQIEITVPLRLSQITCLENDKLPADISKALIFTSSGLARLRNRIVELQDERVSLRQQFKELKRSHKAMLKDLKVKEEEIAVEKKKCDDVQMLKFGTTINLSILEKVGTDDAADDLKQKLRDLEDEGERKVAQWERRIREAKDELAKVTHENTKWLQRVADLTQAQYELEDELNATTKNVHVTDSGPDSRFLAEKKQLMDLVRVQENEIEALKAEIYVLRRKGGQVYAPQ